MRGHGGKVRGDVPFDFPLTTFAFHLVYILSFPPPYRRLPHQSFPKSLPNGMNTYPNSLSMYSMQHLLSS